MSFNAEEFSMINMQRCTKWHDPNSWDLSHWGVAAGGEMGELLNVIKKINREREGIIGNTMGSEELRTALKHECADVVIYLDLLCQVEGINLWDAIKEKFNITSEKNGFEERV